MTIDGGFDVSNKARSTRSTDAAVVVDLGVKLQQPIDDHDHHLSFPFSTVHHVNHHRPFDSTGPISCDRNKSMINYSGGGDIYRVAAIGGGSAVVRGGGFAVGVRTLQQPFGISESISSATTAFKSPGGMAASLGFPFTNAQWKELQRQAMIYKYMMASVPVPPHLLIPTPRLGENGLKMRFANGADLEPGRCRRTDGKKWRCSRDAAPDQKYCERHMHRGRPRSRKHVELNASSSSSNNNNNKKIRPNSAICTESTITLAAISNSTVNNNNGSASPFVGTTMSQLCTKTSAFLDKSSGKIATFHPSGAFGSPFKEPSSLNWMLKGEPDHPIDTNDHQWPHPVHTEIGLATETCTFNNASVLNHHYQEESLSLNSYGNFNVREEDQQRNQCSLFLDEVASRGYIDAWSNDTNSRNTSSVSSDGKPPLSSLSLSMGCNNSMDDEMGQIQMGLGLTKSDQNHDCGTTSTPGGPLAEVLQLRTASTQGTNLSSSLPQNGDSLTPPATRISSPTGVLQKTLNASFSDSSGNSSPTLASSMAKPEIAMFW